jgi:hypothetical protein
MDVAGMVSDDSGGVTAEAGLLQARELLGQVLVRPGFAFSDAQVLENLRVVHSLAGMVAAVKLALVAELDARPGAVPGAAGQAAAVAFLTEGLRQSRPHALRDVAAAAALAPGTGELAGMGAALAAGEVSREHADVAVATLRRIPKALKTRQVEGDDGVTRSGAAVIDEVLTGQARLYPPSTLERLGRQIVARLDPGRAGRFDADAYTRRSCTVGTDFAGMGLYRCVLDPATHVQVAAAITRWSAPRPAGQALGPGGNPVTVKDDRTPGQRRADAISELILAGAATHPVPGDPRPRDGAGPKDAQPHEGTGPQDAQPHNDGPHNDGPHNDGPHNDGPRNEESQGPEADRPEAAESVQPAGAAQPPAQSSEPAGAAGLPAGVFMARPGAGPETCLIATVDQYAAALGATDPAAQAAGLARLGLAGTIGGYPGAVLDPAVLARLACDGPIRRILTDHHGAVLHYGRSQRLASTHQKRALAVRDGGCAIPGCHAPPDWCHAHHLIPWEHGGTTDIDSMVLLCGRHHTAHHAGIYPIQMRDGIPWVKVPSWQDPHQPWLRNNTHQHHAIAGALTTTLTQPSLPGLSDTGWNTTRNTSYSGDGDTG